MNRVDYFFAFMLVMLMCIGLACKKDEEKEQLRAELATKNADVVQIQAANFALQTVGDSIKAQLAISQAKNDSLSELNDKTASRLVSLQGALKKERVRTDSISAVVESFRPAQALLPMCQSMLAQEQKAREDAEAECLRLEAAVISRDSLIQAIKPWYQKWRHDATKRGFLKVMFGSGKAQIPASPEPVF